MSSRIVCATSRWMQEFIALMKARRVPYIATLALDESQFIYAEHPVWMDTPFFVAAAPPELLATWASPSTRIK